MHYILIARLTPHLQQPLDLVRHPPLEELGPSVTPCVVQGRQRQEIGDREPEAPLVQSVVFLGARGGGERGSEARRENRVVLSSSAGAVVAERAAGALEAVQTCLVQTRVLVVQTRVPRDKSQY